MKENTKFVIRAFQPSDLQALHEINQAGVPGVSSETPEALLMYINLSTVFVAEDTNNDAIGFLTLIDPGTLDYPSANLRWFETWLDATGGDLIYVDRIAVSDNARGQKIGQRLYTAAFEAMAHRQRIGCEVNVTPPNPASHAFHQKLGFREIGRRHFAEYSKEVAYYVRDLT